MDYDHVVVMSDGRAEEIGSPSDLLLAQGLFSELVDATGPESSSSLRKLVTRQASTNADSAAR